LGVRVFVFSALFCGQFPGVGCAEQLAEAVAAHLAVGFAVGVAGADKDVSVTMDSIADNE